ARIEGEVGVAEAGVVRRARRTRGAQIAGPVPVDPVLGRPDVHLVAVVRDEGEVTPRRHGQTVAVEVGRPFVGRVDEAAVKGVGDHFGLAAGELLVDVDRRPEYG